MENKDYNRLLFEKLQVYKNEYDIIPNKDSHLGISVDVRDLSFVTDEFINELLDSVIDWVYSQEKYISLKEHLVSKGKNESAAASEILRNAKEKFRTSDDKLLAQGQLGELLLFHFIQRFFSAIPLLRKMPITTSSKHERYGADAIHYKKENQKNIIFLGEAKTYTSEYSFKDAFENSLKSIIDSYNSLSKELNLYVHEDFLDEKMNIIAEEFLDNTLKDVEIHLVSVVTYNETKSIDFTNEKDIKDQIERIIAKRYSSFDNSKIDIDNNPILKRITYIVFPVWALDELAKKFQSRLN